MFTFTNQSCHNLINETTTQGNDKMETIDDQNHYELGDIQNRLKAKAEEYGLHDTAWMEAYQNAEQTALETNNFEEHIKDGWTWITIFEAIALESLAYLR